MYLFVESGIRGGISQISHRYAEANNKYLKNDDKTKEESYILYLDANNLHGGATVCVSIYQQVILNGIMTNGQKKKIIIIRYCRNRLFILR